MLACETHNIRQNNNSKKIPIISPTLKKQFFDSDYESEYSLKQNFFDPTKSSPPNDFMLKLQKRMAVYESFINLDKDDME
jgi:hypothetical protein